MCFSTVRWVTAKAAIVRPLSGWLKRSMYKAIRRLNGIEATSAWWKSDILLCNGYLLPGGSGRLQIVVCRFHIGRGFSDCRLAAKQDVTSISASFPAPSLTRHGSVPSPSPVVAAGHLTRSTLSPSNSTTTTVAIGSKIGRSMVRNARPFSSLHIDRRLVGEAIGAPHRVPASPAARTARAARRRT